MALQKRRFRLDPVLEVRKIREDILVKELADLRKREEDERLLLSMLTRERDKAAVELRQGVQAGEDAVDIAKTLLYYTYLEKLSTDIHTEADILETIDTEVQVKRGQVVKASQDRRIMERLKEKKLAEWREAELRSEENLMDEIGTVAHNRRSHSRSLAQGGDSGCKYRL
ncbi:MAG: flagellar export protein FliJ [Firmicutes bacterium]|nr:flagellar export protein FliJ [Bacillota bacterium]